jgi:glycosyltransferase involved in cell wall biosynthesis
VQRLLKTDCTITLSHETAAAANALANQIGTPVAHCPAIVDCELLPLRAGGAVDDVVRVGWLGEPRREKGSTILPDIIERVLSHESSKRFQFVVQSLGMDRKWLNELNRRLDKFGDSVVRLKSDLEGATYFNALASCDILLLPYDPASYPKERGSGIAIEALVTGIPIVATKETFAASLIDDNCGLTGDNTESLACSVIEIGSDLDKFKALATKRAQQLRSEFDPERLYRIMLGNACQS